MTHFTKEIVSFSNHKHLLKENVFDERRKCLLSQDGFFYHILLFIYNDLVLRAARESWRRREREIMILFILSHPLHSESGGLKARS